MVSVRETLRKIDGAVPRVSDGSRSGPAKLRDALSQRVAMARFGARIQRMAAKKGVEQVGIYVRVDPALAKRLEQHRLRAEKASGGHVPAGTFARALVIEALEAREASLDAV